MPQPMMSDRGPVTYAIDTESALSQSPMIEGFLQGSKAAILAAPIGAAVQALRNKSPSAGALIAGLGAGALAGLTAASIQKYKNLKQEANIRYHLRNMIEREPEVTGPEVQYLQPAFNQGFSSVYNPY